MNMVVVYYLAKYLVNKIGKMLTKAPKHYRATYVASTKKYKFINRTNQHISISTVNNIHSIMV